MKNSWLIYATVAVVSALAGVAIAGPPNRVGTDATIAVPESTSTTLANVPDAGDGATDDEEGDVVADTDAEAESAATTTQPPADTTTTTTTTTVAPPPEVVPAEVTVVAVNGGGIGGLAGRTRDELIALGFTAARAADGTEVVDQSVVYFFPGFDAEAAAVATALGIDVTQVLPVETAPEFGQLEGDQVAVYAGRDRG